MNRDPQGKVIFIIDDSIGDDNEELGRLLMKNFVYALARTEIPPGAIVLMNSGVKLSCEGSESIEDLEQLVSQGVKVYTCGTCLDYLGLKESLKVGEVGSMMETVHMLLASFDGMTIG